MKQRKTIAALGAAAILLTLFTACGKQEEAKNDRAATEVKAKLFSPDSKITVDDISVPDDVNGIALVQEGNGNTSRVFLVKQGGEWRIRSVVPA